MKLDKRVRTQWTEGGRQWVHKMRMQGIGLMDSRHGADMEPDSGTQEWELHSQMLPKINKRSGAQERDPGIRHGPVCRQSPT